MQAATLAQLAGACPIGQVLPGHEQRGDPPVGEQHAACGQGALLLGGLEGFVEGMQPTVKLHGAQQAQQAAHLQGARSPGRAVNAGSAVVTPGWLDAAGLCVHAVKP